MNDSGTMTARLLRENTDAEAACHDEVEADQNHLDDDGARHAGDERAR